MNKDKAFTADCFRKRVQRQRELAVIYNLSEFVGCGLAIQACALPRPAKKKQTCCLVRSLRVFATYSQSTLSLKPVFNPDSGFKIQNPTHPECIRPSWRIPSRGRRAKRSTRPSKADLACSLFSFSGTLGSAWKKGRCVLLWTMSLEQTLFSVASCWLHRSPFFSQKGPEQALTHQLLQCLQRLSRDGS